MCIRDSHISLNAEALEVLNRWHRQRGEPGAGIVFPNRKGAVSYTHLRAHETVLDLVCRLLLEKKKRVSSHIVRHSATSLTSIAMYIIVCDYIEYKTASNTNH